METIKIEIPLLCRSKKNSQEVGTNKYTGKRYLTQSKYYKAFERDCGYYLMKYRLGINTSINLKCTFIVPDRKKRDLTNLENAIADILVKYGVIEDDNYNIVSGWDGSRIIYQKGVEKTIIEIGGIKND